ncbi:hypothetical protein CDL15_Pgr022470 [Punica granatum]|uniref:superoxide dismutase n=1 Tax=Punica granatum TaxID=22663 RepID=A0A218XRU1_PUNGR|nr:hypothetical protein CDL15_Pgr022470 [Punica granatum]
MKLKVKHKCVTDYLVQRDDQVEGLMELLDIESTEVRFVGIHGMGGIGKTTLAKLVFNKLLGRFEKCSFLADVRSSFLRDKRPKEWVDTINRLERVPHPDVQEKLKISYDALDDRTKQIFLDIACFFIDHDKRYPSYMWEACDFEPKMELKVFVHLSMVKIIKYFGMKKLWMHDQLWDLGRKIITNESLKDIVRRSRLWRPEDALKVLQQDELYTCSMEDDTVGNLGIAEVDSMSYIYFQYCKLRNLDGFRLPESLCTLDIFNCPSLKTVSALSHLKNLKGLYPFKTVSPVISCGVYGYPHDEAAAVAISTVKEFSDGLKEPGDFFAPRSSLRLRCPGPYDYSALEPAISGEIMQLHHQKHHQAYITNYNKALEQLELAMSKGDAPSVVKLQSAIKFNGGAKVDYGGVGCAGTRIICLLSFIVFCNGGIRGINVRWLGVDKELKKLVVETTANQDPLVTKGPSLVPLIGIDVWEHAYYLQYKNVRPDYLKNIWKVINWKYASEVFEKECPLRLDALPGASCPL